METIKAVAVYFACIGIITIIATITDKIKAKAGKRRVPEDFLMTLGLVGGALPEYFTMKLIRHKTRHKKFMIGLPILIAVQIIVFFVIYIYTQRG